MSAATEWVTPAIVGAVIVLFASGATGDIKDDVVASCVAFNSDQGRKGPHTNNFCICSAERTAGKANVVHKVKYRLGLLDLSTPYGLGKKFGEETEKLCNALN